MSVSRLERVFYPRLPLRARPSRWQRIRIALIVRWHTAELDHELAAGASPRSSALLASRAQRITNLRNRAHAAEGLARAVRHARTGAGGFTAAVRPNRREVLAALTVISALDRRLRAPEPVTAQGVALIMELLTDGESALYRPSEAGALGSQLRAAAAALEPTSRREPAPAAEAALG